MSGRISPLDSVPATRRNRVYGVYEGQVIFREAMVTQGFLLAHPDSCFDIKTPAAMAVARDYPTRSCFRVWEETGEQRMSIEGFVYRQGSAVEPTTRQAASRIRNGVGASPGSETIQKDEGPGVRWQALVRGP